MTPGTMLGYSFGVLLHLALSGVFPHGELSLERVIVSKPSRSLTSVTMLESSTPAAVEEVVLHLLGPSRDARFAPAVEVREAILRVGTDGKGTSPSSPVPLPATVPARARHAAGTCLAARPSLASRPDRVSVARVARCAPLPLRRSRHGLVHRWSTSA